MAVPPQITVSNLSGIYTLNSTLSDNSQQTLKMQSVSWLVRQAVQYSSIETTLKQYTTTPTSMSPDSGIPGPDGLVHHLDQYQLSTGGIRNFEDRVMDWQTTVKPNKIWGEVRGRSRYIALPAIETDDPWLKEGWDDSCSGEGKVVVEGYVEGVKEGWSAHQIWGFAVVGGERRHVRKILARRQGWKDERVRMVYDWKGPVVDEGKK